MATNSNNPKATATKSQAASLDIAKSDETLDLAKDLAKFIKENKLTTQVQGKEFVNVEAWQYAGSRLGIVPIVEHVINLSTDQELKYQAKVTLYDMRHQTTVGAGFAICSNKESGKKFYQEFAIASMAQTRAIGKAYRNILAWIIRAAGYEPTPAEEMEYSGNVPAPAVAPAVAAETVPMAVIGGGVSEAPAPVEVQYATASQKEEIIRLLDHPLITRQEKTKMLLNINRLDEERATQAIAKLTKAIADREGTTAVAGPAPAEPAGNELAGAPQAATPAGLPFADPAASTTSDPNAAPEPEAAPAPGFSSPEVAAIAQQIEGFTSSMDLKNYWDGLTGGQRKELLPLKEAKQKAILAAIHLAAATASRQNGGAMRPAGTDSALVDAFVNEPVVAGASYKPATQEQRDQLVSLLNDTRITFKEKAALLKAVPSLDTERARQALLTVREAITQREAAGVAAQVAALATRESSEVAHEAGLQAA